MDISVLISLWAMIGELKPPHKGGVVSNRKENFIKLIIDIEKQRYHDILNNPFLNSKIYTAAKKGIPLAKVKENGQIIAAVV